MITLKALIFIFFIYTGVCFCQTDSNSKTVNSSASFIVTAEKKLKLSKMNLSRISLDVFEITDLRSLDLSNNNLISLPKEIKKLKNLETLNLNGNPIFELPVELERLKFLKELYLDYHYWYLHLNEVKKITKAKIILL